MMLHSRRRIGILAFVAAGFVAAPADAQNLLTNPGFNGNLNGWSGAGTYDGTRNNPGSSGSGSARFTATTVGVTTTVVLSQCVPSVAGTLYSVGFAALFETQPALLDLASGSLSFFSGPNCTGPDTGSTGNNTTETGWTEVTFDATAPAGSVSMLATAQVFFNTAGEHAVNYDDFFVVAESSPVPALPTTLLIMVAIAVLGLGVVALKRRQFRTA
jgi:hypothetical protein